MNRNRSNRRAKAVDPLSALRDVHYGAGFHDALTLRGYATSYDGWSEVAQRRYELGRRVAGCLRSVVPRHRLAPHQSPEAYRAVLFEYSQRGRDLLRTFHRLAQIEAQL